MFISAEMTRISWNAREEKHEYLLDRTIGYVLFVSVILQATQT